MAALSARERSSLPNSAFAYIDAKGRRLLPIHDEAHVRNALARFGRVEFEDEDGNPIYLWEARAASSRAASR